MDLSSRLERDVALPASKPAKVRAGRPPGAGAPTGLLTRDAAMTRPNFDSALNNRRVAVTGSKKILLARQTGSKKILLARQLGSRETLLARPVPTQKQGLAHLQGAHIPDDQHQTCMCCVSAARRYHPKPISVAHVVSRCKRRKFLVIRQLAIMTMRATTMTL